MLFQKMRIIVPITLVLIIGVILALGGLDTRRAQRSDGPVSMPERVAGYTVLDVRTSDNTVCYFKDVPHFILQSTKLTHEDLWSSDALDVSAIQQDLLDKGFPEGTEISITGPGISKETAVQERDRWNNLREANGCISFGGRRGQSDESSDALVDISQLQVKYLQNPGYATVVDREIDPNTNHNAQSVVLTAPQVGDNQSNFSAFLNNGFTNAPSGYLLQYGFLFDDGYGAVV